MSEGTRVQVILSVAGKQYVGECVVCEGEDVDQAVVYGAAELALDRAMTPIKQRLLERETA